MTAHHSAPGDVLSRVVTWLRAGYPDGVPEHDYVALFGILHRALTEGEVDDIARRMLASGRVQASEEEIGQAIRAAIHERPASEDIVRVSVRLAQGGWPLDPNPVGQN